ACRSPAAGSAGRSRRRPGTPAHAEELAQLAGEVAEPGAEEGTLASRAAHEDDAEDAEDDVGQPEPDPGRDGALLGETLPGGEQDVVDEDHREAHREAARLDRPGLADAERDPHQPEDDAGKRNRELAVELDQLAGVRLARRLLARDGLAQLRQ